MGADLTLVCFKGQDDGTLHTFLYLSTEASDSGCRDPEKLMQRMFPVHLTQGSGVLCAGAVGTREAAGSREACSGPALIHLVCAFRVFCTQRLPEGQGPCLYLPPCF